MDGSDELYQRLKINFNARIAALLQTKKENSGIMTKLKYYQMIDKVKESQSKVTGKKPEDYQRLKRYDIVEVGGCEKLVTPMKGEGSTIQIYVHVEEIFDIMNEIHLAIDHGGRTRMLKELKKKYKNITCEQIMLYLNLCETCQMKPSVYKKGPLVQPMLSKIMNSRGQIDFIDMENQSDNDYKYILVYKDLSTNFIQLRPLKSRGPDEVANVLLDILTIFGVPSILQSDNGREFCKHVISEMCAKWNNLKIVHGETRHSNPHDLNESVNQDIINMISSWLSDNQTSHWEEGLRFVQFMKNQAHHLGMNHSPHEAMFGSPANVGINALILPDNVEIHTEEELDELLEASLRCVASVVEIQDNVMENTNEIGDMNLGYNEEKIPLYDEEKDFNMKRGSDIASLDNQRKKMRQNSGENYLPSKVEDSMKIEVEVDAFDFSDQSNY